MTPEQEEQVRRVLGSMPPEGALPPAVADRLDATLAELVAERGAGAVDEPAPTVRRRQRWRIGLVAAAAVAVVGLGVTAVVDDLTGSGGEATQSAGDSGQSLAQPEAAPPDAAADSAGSAVPEGVTLLATTRQDLGSDRLAGDVEALVAAPSGKGDARQGLTAESAGPDAAPEAADDAFAAIGPCVVPAISSGDAIAPVRLDGERATLVLGTPTAGTRVARVYSCDDGDTLLATTSVPAP